MKTRNGFVSNSSSSSFIVGIAKVTNLGKLRAYLNKHNIKESSFDVRIAKVGELDKEYCVRVTDSKITVESFQSEASIRKEGMAPSDNVIIVNIMNNEGDTGSFSYDDEFGGVDYDIDLDHFDTDQQALYYLFSTKDAGVDVNTSNVLYGAAETDNI